MILSDGTVSPVTFALLSGITFLLIICDLTKGSADLSGWTFLVDYIKKVAFFLSHLKLTPSGFSYFQQTVTFKCVYIKKHL